MSLNAHAPALHGQGTASSGTTSARRARCPTVTGKARPRPRRSPHSSRAARPAFERGRLPASGLSTVCFLQRALPWPRTRRRTMPRAPPCTDRRGWGRRSRAVSMAVRPRGYASSTVRARTNAKASSARAGMRRAALRSTSMDRPFFPAPRPKDGYREPARPHDSSTSPRHGPPPMQPKRTIVRRPDDRPTRYTGSRIRAPAVLEITASHGHGWRNG